MSYLHDVGGYFSSQLELDCKLILEMLWYLGNICHVSSNSRVVKKSASEARFDSILNQIKG